MDNDVGTWRREEFEGAIGYKGVVFLLSFMQFWIVLATVWMKLTHFRSML
jgi:hypothetical protein